MKKVREKRERGVLIFREKTPKYEPRKL